MDYFYFTMSMWFMTGLETIYSIIIFVAYYDSFFVLFGDWQKVRHYKDDTMGCQDEKKFHIVGHIQEPNIVQEN